MAYVVSIWEQPAGIPLPGDLRAAARLVKLLQRMRPGPNPRYATFIERLTQRYPDICSPEAEELDQDLLAWSDGPLSADSPECVYNLGLNRPMIDSVRPFVIRTAHALGLHVFDDQAGEFLFADGTRISPTEHRRSEIEPAIVERLRPFLAAHGFAPDAQRGDFMRRVDAGWHRIVLQVVETWPPHYEFTLDGEHDNFEVSRLYAAIADPDRAWQPDYEGPLGIAHQERWIERGGPFVNPRGRFQVGGVAELEAALRVIERHVERRLLPLFALCDTAAGYDALMNTPSPEASVFFIEKTFHGWERGYRNALAAHLAGNPRVGAICDEVEAGLEGEPPWSTAFFNTRKCIDFVRREHGLAWGRSKE